MITYEKELKKEATDTNKVANCPSGSNYPGSENVLGEKDPIQHRIYAHR